MPFYTCFTPDTAIALKIFFNECGIDYFVKPDVIKAEFYLKEEYLNMHESLLAAFNEKLNNIKHLNKCLILKENNHK